MSYELLNMLFDDVANPSTALRNGVHKCWTAYRARLTTMFHLDEATELEIISRSSQNNTHIIIITRCPCSCSGSLWHCEISSPTFAPLHPKLTLRRRKKRTRRQQALPYLDVPNNRAYWVVEVNVALTLTVTTTLKALGAVDPKSRIVYAGAGEALPSPWPTLTLNLTLPLP